MAMMFRRVKRIFGFDESKTQKYLVTADRGAPIGFTELSKQVALVSGVNPGVVQATIWGLVTSMITYIEAGHSVRVDGLGTFIPTICAKSSTEEKEANAESIRRVKLNFRPDDSLREMLGSMQLEFNEKDSTNDTKKAEEGSGTEPEEDEPVVQ